VTITYTSSRADQIAQAEMLLRDRSPETVFNHYTWVLYWAAMAALGVYVSVFFGQLFIAAVFVAMFLFYAVMVLPYSRVRKRAMRRLARGVPSKQIRLQIDEQGLHETVDGVVESFAPWNGVRNFTVSDDHLLVELAGDLWAIVPRANVNEGGTAFEELVQMLRSHGIAEKRFAKTPQMVLRAVNRA
jgi:HAMP domain-containing protein